MRVVSNSSPLIGLARINQPRLLQELYAEICVPPAVWQEVVVQGADQPGASQIACANWIRQVPTQNAPLLRALSQDLGLGEAEAIVLAQELPADLLIVDERQARERARRLGLRFIGICGIIVEAKHRGLVESLKPLLHDLKDVAGFRISAALEAEVLRRAGESQ